MTKVTVDLRFICDPDGPEMKFLTQDDTDDDRY